VWRRGRIPPPLSCESKEATKREPKAWGYNRTTLFPGDVNTGTWPSTLGESRIWGSKMWSWIQRDSDPRMTALARTSSNCKRQTHPLVRENVTASVQLENKITGRGSHGACRQDELTEGKPPVVKWLWLWLCKFGPPINEKECKLSS
jgi:hypothetical protein